MTGALKSLLEALAANQPTARSALREMAVSQPGQFRSAALALLKDISPSPGCAFLLSMLLKQNLLIDALCDPARFKLEEVVRITQIAQSVGIPLTDHLVERLHSLLAPGRGKQGSLAAALHLLEALSQISHGTSILPLRDQLLSHPDAGLRAKATLIIGKARHSRGLGRMIFDPDARVRASYVETLWGDDDQESRATLWAATKDPNNRVQANALLGLYQARETACIPVLLKMASHPDPLFQASAAWVMGQTRDPRFTPVLGKLLATSEGSVRTNALRSLSAIRERTHAIMQAGKLRLSLAEAAVQPDGSRKLVALAALPGDAAPSLTAFQFVIREGPELVASFDVTHQPNPALLLVGFALPHIANLSDPFHLACQQGLLACLASRRPPDLWRIARYAAQPAADPDAAGDDAALVALDPDFRKRFRFSPHPALLDTLIRSPGSSAIGIMPAVAALLEAARSLAGARHLIVLGPPPAWPASERPPEALQKLLAEAREHHVTLHAIAVEGALNDAFPLQDLCAATNGSYLAAPSVDAIPALLEKIYGRLLDRYEIAYRLEAPAPSPRVKLQVFADQGFGEVEAPLVAIPFTNQVVNSR